MDLYNIRKKLALGIPLSSLKLRVTEYSRVSTENEKQKHSLINQIEHFDELIQSNPNWTYIPGYVDFGISGTTDYKRESFMQMMEDAHKGKFDLIITKEISRFSRNTLDSIKYTRQLLSYGVAVFFVNDNINTAMADSELRLTIMASMAQDEIRRLSERVKFGMTRAIKKGIILGNNMLYGYQKNKLNGNLEIVNNEALIIQRIYTMYAFNNYSLTKIAKMLNNEHIKTVQNKKWSTTTIGRIIKNPKYKGYYCGHKTEIIDYMTKKVKYINEKDWVMYKDELKVPPIIEENIWNIANNKINKRSIKYGKEYHNNRIIYQSRYPLSSKIICENDNHVYYRRKNLVKEEDISWICSKHLNEGAKSCDSPILRQKEIYEILMIVLEKIGFNKQMIIKMLLSLYKDNTIENDIHKLLSEKDIIEIIIGMILKKIIIKKVDDYSIKLELFFKYINYNQPMINECISFKSGKRYLINVYSNHNTMLK